MIIDTILKLGESKDRKKYIRQLSKILGIDDLIIFIKDPEINKMLPAPGFQQTLHCGTQLQQVVEASLRAPFSTHLNTQGKSVTINGYPITVDSVIVLIGEIKDAGMLEQLQKFLPLLIKLFKYEQELIAKESLVSIIKSEAGKTEKLANVLDKTRQRLQDSLLQQKKNQHAIENLLKKKDEFINIASHELKTPLTSMKGYMDLIFDLKNTSNHQVQNYIVKANRQVEKLIRLVNDLLDVNKLQAGPVELNFEYLELNEIISDSVEEIQTTTTTHHIHLEKTPEEIFVHVDRLRMEQAISNILSNAVKYSPDADKVDVKVEVKGTDVKVSIEDYGIGVAQKDTRLIFDRFYRANKNSNKFYGLGLGLYITSNIIMRHGGKIGVENNSHGGSLFWFTLPVANRQ